MAAVIKVYGLNFPFNFDEGGTERNQGMRLY